MSRINLRKTCKINAYGVLVRAVDEGVLFGLNRAYKHTDEPGKDLLTESICTEVVNALCEVIDFDA